jgi:hypothetical protein
MGCGVFVAPPRADATGENGYRIRSVSVFAPNSYPFGFSNGSLATVILHRVGETVARQIVPTNVAQKETVMTEQTTMPRRTNIRPGIKLTYQARKGWRKDVGKNRWWLGHDKSQALRLAELIIAEWQLIEARGGTTWNEQALRSIQDAKFAFAVGGQPAAEDADGDVAAEPNTAKPKRAAVRSSNSVSLHKATDDYLALKRAESDAGQTTTAHYSKTAHAVRRFRDYFGDVPLDTIGFQKIRALVTHFVGRPKSAATGKPLAPATVIDTITAARSFFEHAADSEIWTAPTTFKRLFAYQRHRLADEVEQTRRAKVQVFSVPELRALWYEMPEKMKLCFCLGLNCGFTQREIATLRRAECRLDSERPYIKRMRHKTSVLGRWRLWPETAQLLRAQMARPNKDGLALLDDAGKPLVYDTGINRRDSISREWKRIRRERAHALHRFHLLRAAVEKTRGVRYELPGLAKRIRNLSFKILRKTGSDFVRQVSDRDTAEVFLAHADPTMGKFYHRPDFKKLAKALRKVRRVLAPVFDSAATPTTAIATATRED